MALFRCTTCNRDFTTQDELGEHQRQAHQRTQGPQCAECGTAFATRTQLDEHKRLEHGQE